MESGMKLRIMFNEWLLYQRPEPSGSATMKSVVLLVWTQKNGEQRNK
jgi:hypothetical protein